MDTSYDANGGENCGSAKHGTIRKYHNGALDEGDCLEKRNTRRIGTVHERQAENFLKDKGYQILTRNFRCRSGEIDLIARDGDCLVFVEVRYRADTGKGHPLETVDVRKQRRICRVSDVYRYRNHIGMDEPVRYDVVAVLGEKLVHAENAFPYLGSAAY